MTEKEKNVIRILISIVKIIAMEQSLRETSGQAWAAGIMQSLNKLEKVLDGLRS